MLRSHPTFDRKCTHMIPVNEAIERIRLNAVPLQPVEVKLQAAVGLVLAQDVVAKTSLPPFQQSSMDGYAFRFEDYKKANIFRIVGKVAAGDQPTEATPTQTAVRIFTGAPLPHDLDTVVMQEATEIVNNQLHVHDETLAVGTNVRKEGAEIKAGEVAVKAGAILSPAAIGFLAGTGVTEVAVYPKPLVHIISTGNELQKLGQPLQHGQVYDSNSVMLHAVLSQLSIDKVIITTTTDDAFAIEAAISTALENADLILLSGGVSVGDYDFVVKAVEACGAKRLFHKVAQRPGKPLYCARKENTIIFGLPGNPASVLTCFYRYVTLALEAMTGRKSLLQIKMLPLAASFSKTVGVAQFLKASADEEKVVLLAAQESFRLSSFSVANCLVLLPEGAREYAAGEAVETLLLPYL